MGRRVAGQEIDDVIQETYSRLIASKSVEQIRHPKAYAFQTAYSVLLTNVRRASVVSFKAVADIDYLRAIADAPSPEDEVADRDELHRLAVAIASLPKRVGQVFALRRVQGLSQREVAVKLGLSESTVEKHMARGLHLLAQQFSRGGKPPSRVSNTENEETWPEHGTRGGA